MKTATLNKGKEMKYLNGYPLIDDEDVFAHDHLKEGDLFLLVNDKHQFIATAYVGRQHKGLGWVLSYDKDEEINIRFFESLFETAKEERSYFYNIEGTNAFRVFNGEGDGVGGLTIDNYNGHFLIQWYSKGIYKYRYQILNALKNVFKYTSLFEKMRFKDAHIEGGFVDGEVPEFPIVIEENHTFYNVDLNDGPMTGIFLDQKEVRKKLRDQFADNRYLLNMFSYTGAFSVVSAEKAKVTTSVDLANRSRSLTEENFGLNAIDPPSFARNKKKTFSVLKDYDKLILGALEILSPGGTLLLCTNNSTFSLKAFKKVIKDTLNRAEVDFEFLEVMGLPKDFKTHPHYKPSKYLKAIFVNVQ
ncbi:class I SAM-dependent rRNA methyltransferase [Staphylococcus nepalensis]|uniref:class I SAM-dependent rRNA methyltransferase n=1 Tax=Staphylococcus nepalensis TaxID=214473 RepID=UPI0024BB556B|nr:class I SAM-dependent rRNA methyltransferase [Staphylococcus nepalensis]